jgi:hypothetical protein
VKWTAGAFSSYHGAISITSEVYVIDTALVSRRLIKWVVGTYDSQMAFSGRFTVFIGLILLVVTVGLSAFAPYFTGQRWYNFFLLSLIGLAGGVGGWFLGIQLSPLGIQRQGVRQIATAISAFWGGVIVANISKIWPVLIDHASWVGSPRQQLRLLYLCTVFLFAFTATFNTRFDDSQIGDGASSQN